MTTLTASQQKVQDAYQNIFGRNASFGTLGGADYWTDQIDNNSLSDSELNRILTDSSEGQSVATAADGTKSSLIGGVNPNLSVAQNIANDANAANPWDKSWASHFTDGGALTGDLTGTIWEGMAGAGTATNPTTQNVAGLLNATYNANNPNSPLPNPYYNNAPIIDPGTGPNIPTPVIPTPVIPTPTPTPPPDNPTPTPTPTPTPDDPTPTPADPTNPSTSGNMDDFMRFMMFMMMMRPQGGMGGGSQYGYGGLNPGGVMSAYTPWII